jgi:hypothetical protein
MSWWVEDVKRLKEEKGQDRQLERTFYPLLVKWIEDRSMARSLFQKDRVFTPSMTGIL